MKTSLAVGAALVLAVGSMSADASGWRSGGHGWRGYHRGPSVGAIVGTTLAAGLIVGAVDATVTPVYPAPVAAYPAYGYPAYGYAPYGYGYGYAPAAVYPSPVIYSGRRW